MGCLIDDILHIHDFALAVSQPIADYVPGSFQLLQGGTNAVRTLLADFRKPPGGVVPVLRQGQHHGEQPFGFEGQPRVAQVVVGHHRVVAGFLNAKYRHGITSFRRSLKVFVFGENRPLCRPDAPDRKTYVWWFLADCDKKNTEVSTPFKTVLDTKNAIGLGLWRVIP